MVRKYFVSAKNAAVATALKTYLNERFGKRLHVSACALDTDQASLRIEGSLHRLPIPLHLTVENYQMERENDQDFIVVTRITSSLVFAGWWLNRRYAGRRFALPRSIAALL